MIKEIWSKHKRILLIVFAAVFLVALFFLKTRATYKNETNNATGLAYSTATIGDLVNKDTDGDGIPDWEEKLWGTDPTKKETTPGIPDSVAIEKLKSQQIGQNQQGEPLINNGSLTKTDQFSQDLFATVAATSQDGQTLDQATIDKISSSLADQIQNSAPRKVYTLLDIKIIKDDSVQAVRKYGNALNSIAPKNSIKYTVADVLQKLTADENNPDISVLSQLDPFIKQTNTFIDGIEKMEVPESLSVLHLNLLNALEDVQENLSDMKLFDADTIVALSAMNQYGNNTTLVKSALGNIFNAINQKLKQ